MFSGPANPNEQAIPYGGTLATTTVGTWLAAGPAPSNNTNPSPGDATLTLGLGVTGVRGSPDSYNSFTFLTAGPTGATYTLQTASMT